MIFSHGQTHYPVFAYAQDYPNQHIELWHSHAHIQILHTLHGVLEVQTPCGFWIVPPNKAIWIPANYQHQLKAIGQVKVRGVFIQPNTDRQQCKIISVSPLLQALMCSALNITQVMPNSREQRILDLILDEVTFLQETPFDLPQPQTLPLVDICDFLKANLSEQWTLDDIANQFCMSSKTLARYFKKELSMNFGTWLRQAKLLHALTLLATEHSILDTALCLGYESPSAFTAMFKRETGTTPREYLKLSISQ